MNHDHIIDSLNLSNMFGKYYLVFGRDLGRIRYELNGDIAPKLLYLDTVYMKDTLDTYNQQQFMLRRDSVTGETWRVRQIVSQQNAKPG